MHRYQRQAPRPEPRPDDPRVSALSPLTTVPRACFAAATALAMTVLPLAPVPATAQEASSAQPWPYCPATVDIPERPRVEEKLEPGDVHILADHAELIEKGVSRLEGNVQITRDQQQTTADRIDYDQTEDTAELSGNVQYWDDSVYLHGDSASLDLDQGTGSMQNARYRVVGTRGRGDADELYLDVGTLTRGTRISYTTCDPEAPGMDLSSNAWRISAGSITLNHETDRGTARNVVLRIKDIPVFYTPYLSFPLSDKRKSGFLIPGFGSTSTHGLEIRTPYYFNIAPNMDATLTPRWLTDSGMMAAGEFRYLLASGEGQVNVEYLPSDNRYNDRDRSLVGFVHDQTFADTGRLFMTYNRVSDLQYLEDFGSQLRVTSTRFLERRADISYGGGWWRASARLQDFQITDDSVDPASEPYQKLPQIRLGISPLRGNRRLNFNMTGEIAYFNRDNNLFVNDVNGARFDLYPSISYPIETRSTFFTPKLGVRYTQYDLTDTGPYSSSPSRTLPIASLDTGVFMERNFQIGGRDMLQTLEPRLYYLYIPDDDQQDIPVFDTSIFNPSFPTLFRENRFTSIDRIGDANQVTLGLTSRIIDRSDGSEFGYVRLGQQYYFSDVNVIRFRLLPNGTLRPEDIGTRDNLGLLIGEMGVHIFEDFSLKAEWQWEPNENITEKMVFRAQYNPDDARVLNFAYRVHRAPSGVIRRSITDIEQTDVSFRWPVTDGFSVVGRWNYAVPERRTLELFAGVEYESCCWGIRAVARRFLNNLDGDFSTGIFLQFELKGLAGLGSSAVDFLSQRIPGYEPGF